MIPRILAGLIGGLFLLQTMGWLVDPTAAAKQLNMTLLEGLGRSTQIGDFSSFFFALGSMALLGAIRSNGTWLRGAALLLGGAAVFRTLAWALHGATFATEFIAIEALTAIVLLFIAARFDSQGGSSTASATN
jgi:hypothetical protein